MSYAPPSASGWTVVEWMVDVDPLVMGPGFGDFLDGNHCLDLFLIILSGGRSFSPRLSFSLRAEVVSDI
jgi:hypothetical protein